ncbi:MAG: Asp-tRNA(Asn)/Glu-tRNA(Gln) amidotransferase subunit GatA [candidate division WOR-3 bacterium]|nr:Asp-tRNA(Asn)/Glu-tRNA(Gln) amidotransferase subunit GatA [candidate division WOR-3 bacterium]
MMTINDYLKLFDEGKLTPEELFESCCSKIDPDLNAFITVTKERARNAIGSVDGKIRGIPIAVKDNINVKGVPTTCGSKILKGFIPPYSATVVERIEKEGGLLIGKTNLDEFAMGSSTENSHFGLTKNPFDRERVPGGSSGGSAVAVATGSAIIALGSDTGGSVRQPASFCGLVGLKPTYGRVSRYGLVAFASSLDQIGIIGRNAMDVGILLVIIAGKDPLDSTSVTVDVQDYTDLDGSLEGIKIGIPEEYFVGIDEDVLEAVIEIKEILQDEGVSFSSVSLPTSEYVIPTYQIISYAEASSNLARYDGVRYGLYHSGVNFSDEIRKTRNDGFLSEVKRRILVGSFVLSSQAIGEYYEKALTIRSLIKKEFKDALDKVDYLLTPTTPSPAFKIGERFDDPLKVHLSDRLTAGANLAGIPAVSAPAGMSRNNLPIGYQLMGRPFDEKGLLSIVHQVEKIKPFELLGE